ncbi:SULT1 [Mytilus coruscus]|uniref:SULT1 n=1 Tax=Mytilus coruscus TaxID=42192 RepID=A0A6J8CYQ5_MYTCO|nr:SULT1 [Mytilus coruscus]
MAFLDMEKIKKIRESLKPVPLPEHDGVCYPSFPPFREKGAEQALQDITNFLSRDTDIMICAGTDILKSILWKIKDPKTETRKLADFLEVQCTDKLIEDIVEATSFENMKEKKIDLSKAVDGITHKYRKRIEGDWKNHFTVAQNEQFDAQYAEKFQDSSYTFIFD